ncbi:DNA cytosine methyltransferase [Brevibacillus agri]|uniref:DNA cytosine methyltransferase n=1 Tax=Brevibacillus TaxID=55080 RepID=UPI002E1B7AB1|nr:DNA cytosine methyltransferase [Brevibacillus borstelensis]
MAIALSFFSGAGGLDMGIQQAGFDIKLTVEIEETYCETLKRNHPELKVVQGDIMEYSKERVFAEAGLPLDQEIDLFFGGSPCQSFSTAGKRQAFSDPRGQAMLKFAELVTEIRPKVFLLENVRGLLSAALKHRPINQRGEDSPALEPDEMPGSALKHLLSKFTGYNVTIDLINAADYGVPQTRERVFVIGVRSDLGKNYAFPEKTHTQNGSNGTSKWVTLGEVLNNLSVENHHFVEYSPERLHYMKMVPKGGGYWRDLPKDVVKQAMGGAYESGGGKMGFFRRLYVDKPAPTLLTSPMQKSTNLGHPYEDRPLSIEEYLAIQEFPIDYQISGTLSQQYIQIGNAVPVRLAKVIGQSIHDLINETQHDSLQLSQREVAVTSFKG